MVSKDRIKDEGLTTEDVLATEVETPQESVEIVPEWEEWPEEAPGDNLHIDDEWLVWERDGFEARLTNVEPTKWRAVIDVPEEYGTTHPRPFDVKCLPLPEHGFVEDATCEDYKLTEATIIVSENFQPTFEVNQFIDHLIETTEGMEQFQAELEEKLNAARANE